MHINRSQDLSYRQFTGLPLRTSLLKRNINTFRKIDPGRRSKVREHGDGKQPRGLFSLLIILLSRGRCGVSLKEQREMRPVILMLHCLFCNHYYLFSLYNTRDSSYLFVLRENHMIQRKELCFRGPGL